MPSFDIVSEVDKHELTNAVDQANRELSTRYDFRGVEASFELGTDQITLTAEEEFQIEQMLPMLQMALAKRKIDQRVLGEAKDQKSGKQVKRTYPVKQGVDQTTGKQIVKMIKTPRSRCRLPSRAIPCGSPAKSATTCRK